MNRIIVSVLISLLFLLPLIIFAKKSLIDNATPIHNIKGVISKVECKKINRRLNGEVYIYYNKNHDHLKFQDDLLKDNNFKCRCRELSNNLEIGKIFYAKTVDIFDMVIDVRVDTYHVLNFDDIVKQHNEMTNGFIFILLFIGILTIGGNVIIYYKKLNPDKLFDFPWFQKVLYIVAIMGILRFLLDYIF